MKKTEATQTQTVVGSSLLFSNIKVTTKQDSITKLTTEHTDIHPDYGQLVKGAAITGQLLV